VANVLYSEDDLNALDKLYILTSEEFMTVSIEDGPPDNADSENEDTYVRLDNIFKHINYISNIILS
jgi:hypothetical protein